MDLYVFEISFSILGCILVGFIFLFEVFTFFELLDDIARHHTPFIIVLNYFRYNIPFPFLPDRAAGRAGSGAGDDRRDDEKQ